VKILIGSPTLSGIGGIARHVQGLSNFLKSKGHIVEIISSDNTLTIPINKLKNPSFMISAFVKSTFKKNFDIVHAQGTPAAFAMKNASGKRILSLHGIHHKQIKLLHGKTAGFLAEKYEKFALDWADVITVSSKEMSDYYEEKGYTVEFIPNAIDIENLPQEENRRYEKQIIYAARLSKEKGIFDVLEISKKLPTNFHLIILGDGSERKNVEEYAKQFQNIHYLGPKSKEETISLIRGSDILIQPSLMEGGISYTLLESLACRTPIICTSVGGGKEFFTHMKNSYLVEPHDQNAILEGIKKLMSNSQDYDSISNFGYESVQKFNWNQIGLQYLKIYEKLLSSEKEK
jgi:glycosyltransferase involved in cell wall biosynthesis